MKRRNRLIAVLALAALGFVGLVYASLLGIAEVETGQNVPRVDWLPASATNVSFLRSYPWTAYEFDISEPEFLKWSDGWPVRKLEGNDRATIPRYVFLVFKRRAAHAGPQTDAEAELRFEEEAASYKEIRHGYFYERRDSNGGGVVVGYDLDNGRAYFQSSPR